MEVPILEKELGLEVYATQPEGIGGKIRQFPEDFLVEEILVEGNAPEITRSDAEKPPGKGIYLICKLTKRNWDTLRAVKIIAKRLGISHKRIRIAGLKDTKALTTQHISIRGVSAERVTQAKIKDMTLLPLYYSNRKIFSQLLFGNHFQIVVRTIGHSSKVTKQRVKKVQKALYNLGGFPNFYGHQRFGTIRPITHLVGRFLVKGNLKKAAFAFLAQPSIHEHPDSRNAREELGNTQDFKVALDSFPKFLRYERLMLDHLAKYPNDYVGAFRNLPLKLRKLFVHAYQSFLFNRFLSQRIKQSVPLNEPQVGDYVIKLDNHGLPTKNYTKTTIQNLHGLEKEIKNKKAKIAIPLVGQKQVLSQGIQGEIEREILEREEVELTNFNISFMPEVSSMGDLRATIVPLINLSIEEPYEDNTSSLSPKFRFSFTLPRGSYATVLLREFMKPQDLITAGF